MSSSTLYSRLGAALALIGTIIILWIYLYVNVNNVSSDPLALGVLILILLLLIINAVAIFMRPPIWLAIIRMVLLVCGLLILLYCFVIGLDFRCFDANPCPSLSLADFFREPLAILTWCLGGLLLNFVGIVLSLRQSRPKESIPGTSK